MRQCKDDQGQIVQCTTELNADAHDPHKHGQQTNVATWPKGRRWLYLEDPSAFLKESACDISKPFTSQDLSNRKSIETRGRWLDLLSTWVLFVLYKKKVASLKDHKTQKQPTYLHQAETITLLCVCASKTLLNGVNWLLILFADHLSMSLPCAFSPAQRAKSLLYLYSDQTSA